MDGQLEEEVTIIFPVMDTNALFEVFYSRVSLMQVDKMQLLINLLTYAYVYLRIRPDTGPASTLRIQARRGGCYLRWLRP